VEFIANAKTRPKTEMLYKTKTLRNQAQSSPLEILLPRGLGLPKIAFSVKMLAEIK
jgi:hypothetical protein